MQKMTPGPWRAFVRDIEQMSDGGKGYPLNVYPDCATVHVGHPTVDDERTGNVGLRRQEDIDGIVALVNAWPAVKEGIAQLQRELSMCQSYLELIENRRDPPPDAALDGADPAIVRLELLQCLRAWEPAARVLGNVRACDAERAIVEGQDRVAALEKERDEAQAERNAHARDVMHLEAENERLRALVAQQREALRDISEHLQCDPPCKMKPAQGKCGECGAYRFETWCAGCVARAVLAAEGDDHA